MESNEEACPDRMGESPLLCPGISATTLVFLRASHDFLAICSIHPKTALTLWPPHSHQEGHGCSLTTGFLASNDAFPLILAFTLLESLILHRNPISLEN